MAARVFHMKDGRLMEITVNESPCQAEELVLIVAVGFCGSSVLELCYDHLTESRDRFFLQSDFCDGFVECTDAPISQE